MSAGIRDILIITTPRQISRFRAAAKRRLPVLGDNISDGHGLPVELTQTTARLYGATIFGYIVNTPAKYGVVELDGRPGHVH